MRKNSTVATFTDSYGDQHRYIACWPERYTFAHSRHIYYQVELRDGEGVADYGVPVTATITDADSDKSYSVMKYTDRNGKVTFDLACFIQALSAEIFDNADFDYSNDSELVNAINLEGKMTAYGKDFAQFETQAVNGTMEVTDRWWSNDRRLAWWKNFPFTFDFANVDEVSVTPDGGATTVRLFPQIDPTPFDFPRLRVNASYFQLNPRRSVHFFTNNGMIFGIAAPSDLNNVPGSAMFLYSSPKGSYSISLDLEVRDCEPKAGDVYVRWLDKHGELSYCLLHRYRETKTTTMSESRKALPLDERFVDDKVMDNAVIAEYDSKSELVAFSGFVEKWEYDLLLTMTDAPFVDMLDMGEYINEGVIRWHRIHVKPGAFAENQKNVADNMPNRQFVATFILPEQNHIRL